MKTYFGKTQHNRPLLMKEANKCQRRCVCRWI